MLVSGPGEPGTSDVASIRIPDAGLNVTATLTYGNQQAHKN